jgi:hypothetical protein
MGILVEGIASLHGSVSMSVVQYLRFKMIRKLIQQGKSHAFTFFRSSPNKQIFLTTLLCSINF